MKLCIQLLVVLTWSEYFFTIISLRSNFFFKSYNSLYDWNCFSLSSFISFCRAIFVNRFLLIITECSVIRVFKRSFSFRKSSILPLVGLSAIFTNRLSTVSGVVTLRHSGHDLFLKKKEQYSFLSWPPVSISSMSQLHTFQSILLDNHCGTHVHI